MVHFSGVTVSLMVFCTSAEVLFRCRGGLYVCLFTIRVVLGACKRLWLLGFFCSRFICCLVQLTSRTSLQRKHVRCPPCCAKCTRPTKEKKGNYTKERCTDRVGVSERALIKGTSLFIGRLSMKTDNSLSGRMFPL